MIPMRVMGRCECSVRCPEHFSAEQAEDQCADGRCSAIGHTDCRGGSVKGSDGSFLNAFGRAFRDAGYQWTQDLCEADSDGDGRSNGEELGDPCCVWRAGQPLPVDAAYVISHPGLAEDTTTTPVPPASHCRELRAEEADSAASSEAEAVDALFQEGEDRHEIHFRHAPDIGYAPQ